MDSEKVALLFSLPDGTVGFVNLWDAIQSGHLTVRGHLFTAPEDSTRSVRYTPSYISSVKYALDVGCKNLTLPGGRRDLK